MAKPSGPTWTDAPAHQDFPAAAADLSLLASPARSRCSPPSWARPPVEHKAKDILRTMRTAHRAPGRGFLSACPAR